MNPQRWQVLCRPEAATKVCCESVELQHIERHMLNAAQLRQAFYNAEAIV